MGQPDGPGEEAFDHDRLVLAGFVVRQGPAVSPLEGDPGQRRGRYHSLKELASVHKQLDEDTLMYPMAGERKEERRSSLLYPLSSFRNTSTPMGRQIVLTSATAFSPQIGWDMSPWG